MSNISMSIDTEQAVRIILDVQAALCSKRIADEAAGNDDAGFQTLEVALAMAAKAIDVEHFDGALTQGLCWVEGSAD